MSVLGKLVRIRICSQQGISSSLSVFTLPCTYEIIMSSSDSF